MYPYTDWLAAKERQKDILRWAEARRQVNEARANRQARGRLLHGVRIWAGTRLIALGEYLAGCQARGVAGQSQAAGPAPPAR